MTESIEREEIDRERNEGEEESSCESRPCSISEEEAEPEWNDEDDERE